MSQISELGNNVGYIYVTKPNGTSLVTSIQNTEYGKRHVKMMGVAASSTAVNMAATGTITISAVSGSGSITQILIDSINQIDTAIAYTVATTPTALAALIASGINSYSPSGNNYTAISIAGVVYVFAPQSAGSSVNDLAITVSNSGNLTVTTTALTGGSDASEVFDEGAGYRFFLNASSTAAEGNLSGATEITNYIIQRGLQSAIDAQSLGVVSGVITPVRKSVITNILIDTESLAETDELTSITPTGLAEWDILIIRGTDENRIVTIEDSTGNIYLEGGTDFDTGDYTATLMLQYRSGSFYEVSRSSQQIGSVANYRASLFPFTSLNDFDSNTITAAGGTVTLTANNGDNKLQKFVGTATLGANYIIDLSSTGAINGDEFILSFNQAVTLNGFVMRVTGVNNYEFTTTQALNGGVTIYARFTSGGWYLTVLYNFSSEGSAGYAAAQIEAEFLAASSVTPSKLTEEGRMEVITIPVSFETGEQGNNVVVMPYSGTVKSIFAISTKAIAATDAATITPQNNTQTAMTAGTITFPASTAIDNAYTSTPTANNTFVAGDYLYFLTAKATAGGKALVSVKVERS